MQGGAATAEGSEGGEQTAELRGRVEHAGEEVAEEEAEPGSVWAKSELSAGERGRRSRRRDAAVRKGMAVVVVKVGVDVIAVVDFEVLGLSGGVW
jgi:hypothetical protein